MVLGTLSGVLLKVTFFPRVLIGYAMIPKTPTEHKCLILLMNRIYCITFRFGILGGQPPGPHFPAQRRGEGPWGPLITRSDI